MAILARDDVVFTVVYLLAGAYLIGRLWSGQAVRHLAAQREFVPRAFSGEEVPVRLHLRNTSWLPVIWLRLQESVPVELAPPNPMQQVISMGPRGQAHFDYTMKARKRGYYTVGPLFAATGDLLGLGGEQRWQSAAENMVVYPRIIQFSNLKLPSHSPMGTLRHTQPIYEDPTRVFGKRDYTAGDSLRRVDWKASAAVGRLQVKQYEPSISLSTVLALNMNTAEYDPHAWRDATELAVIIAASLANWVIGQRQMVGLLTNGMDPLSVDVAGQGCSFRPVPARKGRAHLMRLLDVLARVETIETEPLADLLNRESALLPWGTTLVLITGRADDRLFDELFRLRRAGLNLVLILTGQSLVGTSKTPAHSLREIKALGEQFGFPVYHFRNELELDAWRQ
ncbi:MAG TPA: DUF58 domain-containing protein [Anaerolineales bacterium]|mgnify:CR=1 FL=1|nr:DUF58 domain-containing protein [Anaerolineales bacterium]